MSDFSFGEAVETLSTITAALGSGLAIWGVINLLEAYKSDAAQTETIAEYDSRITEIDGIVQRLYRDKRAGKITEMRYARLCAAYEAEQAELIEAVDNLRSGIRAQKRQGMEQLLSGADIAFLSGFLGSPEDMRLGIEYLEAMREKRGAMPV